MISTRAWPEAQRLPRALWFMPLLWPLLLGLLLEHGTASAQDVAGSVQGTVVAAERPETQVLLTLTGTHIQMPRTTRSGPRGFFQFTGVPPGRYDLRAERLGLRTLVVRDLVVVLGRTTDAGELSLVVEAIPMEPVVTVGARSRLDPVNTAGGGALDAVDYEALPVDRDYKSLMTVLPGANLSRRGDPVNVGGSTGLENQYYIDGVNVTDAKTAGRATSLPWNFVRAVEVKTGGYEAQYGRALGAVVNAVTYSGTNEFEAGAFGYLQPASWSLEPRLAPTITEQGAIVYDWGGRLGGPLVRNRLWYSAAVNPRIDTVEKEIAGLGLHTDRTRALRFASKLTWQAGGRTNLELSAFGDPTTRNLVDQPESGLPTVLAPDPLLARVESGGVVASLRGHVLFGEGGLLQFSASRQEDRYRNLPATAQGREAIAFSDFIGGTVDGGRPSTIEEDRDRTSFMVRRTMFLASHTLIAGAEYEDTGVASRLMVDYIYRVQTDDGVVYQRYAESADGTVHNRSPVLYLQDNWRLSETFALNPGLRWSAQYLVGGSGRTALAIPGEWQPRLGFTWRLGSDEKRRLFGSCGRYYQTLPNNISLAFFVDYLGTLSLYHSDPRDPASTPFDVIDYSTSESDFAGKLRRIQAENFDEFTLGFEQVMGEQSKFTVRAIRRDLRSSFQWGADMSRDGWLVLGTPGEGDLDFLPPPKREYTALEVSADGAWRRWRYRASYVLSRLWGNYPGLFDADYGYELPGRVLTFFMPHQAANSTGFLPGDRPHALKLAGVWASGSGFDLGLLAALESGEPINDFAEGPLSPLQPTFVVPRGTAGRMPALWNLDLRLGYDLPRTRGPRWRVELDILHLGNPRSTTRVDELHYLVGDDDGLPDDPNPRYGNATAYQPPLAVRLGAQAHF